MCVCCLCVCVCVRRVGVGGATLCVFGEGSSASTQGRVFQQLTQRILNEDDNLFAVGYLLTSVYLCGRTP